jgi:hypothetical protein
VDTTAAAVVPIAEAVEAIVAAAVDPAVADAGKAALNYTRKEDPGGCNRAPPGLCFYRCILALMVINTLEAKQQAHELIEQLGPDQIAAVVKLLEVMIHEDDDELTEADRSAIAASREYFRQGGQGTSFEQVVAQCGFTMDQIRKP